jgi:hypothetical protein
MSVKNWSTTAGNNASVDNINFAEGQTPSSVNNSARALMADVKEWYDQITAGTISGTVGGSANAITLTTTPTVGAYATNQRYLFKATAANTVSNPTLNVSGLGTRTIVAQGGGALPVPAWAAADMVLFAYDGASMMLVGTTSYIGTAASNFCQVNDSRLSDQRVPTDGSVTTAKIGDAQVTPAKLSQPFTDAGVRDLSGVNRGEWTGIPSWARKITLGFANIVTGSGTSTDTIRVRVGNTGLSPQFRTSQYYWSSTAIDGLSLFDIGALGGTNVGQFAIFNANNYAAGGVLTFTLINGDIWAASYVGGSVVSDTVQGGGWVSGLGAGSIERVEVYKAAGNFTAGTVRLFYE